MSVGEASGQQHRDGIQEFQQALRSPNESLYRAAREAIKGIAKVIDGIGRGVRQVSAWTKALRRGRKTNPLFDVAEDIKVIFFPVPESAVEFQKRRAEVQTMMAKIILLGKKRGRPSLKEEIYEEAA